MSTFSQESFKGLDAEFSSFGEAVKAYMMHNGFGDEKNINTMMVRDFCRVNKLPITAFDTDRVLPSHLYFADSQWLIDFLETHRFIFLGQGNYIKLDAGNRPIGYVSVEYSSSHNFSFSYLGELTLGESLVVLVNKHAKADEIEKAKPQYYEIVQSDGISFMGRAVEDKGGLSIRTGTIDNERIAHDAFYPYLDGGIDSLFQEFLASESSVLIIVGEPGTGKTSGITSAVTKMNLAPIYAKKTEVIENPKFISSVFDFSDKFMGEVNGSKKADRGLLFNERRINEVGALPFDLGDPSVNENRIEGKIPVIIVEDAEILLLPRESHGNKRMAELLNCTDGMGSNHSRKIIFTTNNTDLSLIDPALMRTGRCFDVLHFRLLTPMEAIEARSAAGLPAFDVNPTQDISLADALRKPRKKIYFENGAPVLKDVLKH